MLLLLLSHTPLLSQRLLEESLLQVSLSDGTTVSLYQAMDADPERTAYYYAPVNLRISERNGIPEFSFIAYQGDDGSIQGGIMHWLLTWGLTRTQQQELEMWLMAEVGEQAVLMGSANVTSQGASQIVPAGEPLARLLQRSLTTGSDIPQIPGGKMAASFQFNAADAQILQQAMKHPQQLEKVSIRWAFVLPLFGKVPAGYAATEHTITLQKNIRQLINP